MKPDIRVAQFSGYDSPGLFTVQRKLSNLTQQRLWLGGFSVRHQISRTSLSAGSGPGPAVDEQLELTVYSTSLPIGRALSRCSEKLELTSL
ncbi:hypothetical protein RRG08_032766 [Elysia crispata]|uniref:Uncharacterized protein n=1 Tax=Elysia crispata TaxID=231223 RepID=A0AAE0YP00_9GAST|nr:hypothetical protein RRG08_032766 [Elysia crispata]